MTARKKSKPTTLPEKYAGVDNDGVPKSEYLERLAAMSESKLADECQVQIFLSAWAHNNPRSDYHWHADACWDECKRRGKPEIYDAAYKAACAEAGVTA